MVGWRKGEGRKEKEEGKLDVLLRVKMAIFIISTFLNNGCR